MKKMFLDKEEAGLEKELEKGERVSVPDMEAEVLTSGVIPYMVSP
jgi:hypothetical protein